MTPGAVSTASVGMPVGNGPPALYSPVRGLTEKFIRNYKVSWVSHVVDMTFLAMMVRRGQDLLHGARCILPLQPYLVGQKYLPKMKVLISHSLVKR